MKSEKYSFKGWNFFTLLSKHRDGVIAALSGLVFFVIMVKMLFSSEVYDVQQVILMPSAAAGTVWTMLHSWVYFKNEQK